MEVLTLNGHTYVKASKAARDLGYAADYVGQLCRSGSVDAHLVGRTWYVNPETLGAHRIEKKRNSRVKAREHAKRSIEAAKSMHLQSDKKVYKNIEIRYEQDQKELIPEVAKVAVVSHVESVKQVVADDGPKFTIENEDKKILMSGSIPVRDAELEEQFTDTVLLTPKITRRKPRPAITDTVRTSFREDESDVARRDTFSHRLEESGVAIPVTSGVASSERAADMPVGEAPIEVHEAKAVLSENSSGFIDITLRIVALFLILGSIASVFLAFSASYQNETFTSKIFVDADKILQKI